MKLFLFLCLLFASIAGKGQTLPAASSCTSKDLELVGASLPVGSACTPSGTFNLNLSINNKTGSERTAFALWGTLVRTSASGVVTEESIVACAGPIPKSKISTLVSDVNITLAAGETLVLKDLFLAWTTSNNKEDCNFLKNNPGTISPKCGTQPSIRVEAGLNGDVVQQAANCSANGAQTASVLLSPYAGKAPYKVSVDGGTVYDVAAGGTYQFTGLSIGSHTFTIKDANVTPCVITRTINLTPPGTFTGNAGEDFTITCAANVGGKQIGEASATGFTYSWSPATGLSNASVSNPTANPSVTTTYTVTKTNTSTGCKATDEVTVTVTNTTVTAAAGDDFTKTCTAFTTGKQIGEASVQGFTYTWLPTTDLSSASVSNPTANPSQTTTYTVTKTNTNTGCFDTDEITVTVNNAAVTAAAGDDFTKTCTANPNGKQIGETSVLGFTYTWLPTTGLSSASVSNPTANPSQTTTYTVTKTNTSTGCFDTDEITVTLDNAAVTAAAGDDFTKTCTANPNGKQIGEASVQGFTYTWLPTTGLSNASVSNPTANPTQTTTYTVTKTNTNTGCFDTDEITVTVNDALPSYTVCLVQPSLCSSSGSVTFNATGGGNFEYSINGGTSYQPSNVFSNLGSGMVTGFKVRNTGTGCVSELSCQTASNCSNEPLGAAPKQNTVVETFNENNASTLSTDLSRTVVNDGLSVKAYPNPFSSKINFNVNSPISGTGSIELYNMQGQKLTTVFQGKIPEGSSTYQSYAPGNASITLLYVLRVGDKTVTGKLLNSRK
jgi:hypothetical protein